MELSVSMTSMGLENYDSMKNTAKSILQKNGATSEIASNTAKTIFPELGEFSSSAAYALKASTQITLNKTLSETLKYLRAHSNVKKKEHILGELWQIVNTDNEEYEKNPYESELFDFIIDYNAKNIFAA